MGNIRVLDPATVSRIAAGEVVERPASVVKELVENALDSGATQVSVEARGGGVGLVRVTDNGCGIAADQVEIAFERHATSKISRAADLDAITTLGFRGEALPSIAAVSQVELVTCPADASAGAFISLEGGVVTGKGARGRSPGTTVTVRNLFQKVPARLKFLKSAATENSHIATVVSQYALAFPEVRFTLVIDGRVSLRTTGSGRLVDAVAEVYGLDIARQMLSVGEEDTGRYATPTVTGLVGAPDVSRANRDYLSFFVGRRWVNSRLLAWAVEEAYHGLLRDGRHPVAVINVSPAPGEVDVNIHPGKTEVKFQNERAVFAAVQKAVRQALVRQSPVPRIEETAPAYGTPGAAVLERPPAAAGLFPSHPPPATPPEPSLTAALPVLRVLGQFGGCYIAAEGPDGLYLIDQHAAHERIMFEKIAAARGRQEGVSQGLLEAVPLEVSPRQEAALRDMGHLADFGFDIEAFGGRTLLVRAVPGVLRDKDWKAVLMEILDSASGGGGSDWREGVAVSLACHSAVRAGQVLSQDEMRELVRQLEGTALPHTCPHGRPTMVRLSSARLERDFGRG